jgi:hypothetical protein
MRLEQWIAVGCLAGASLTAGAQTTPPPNPPVWPPNRPHSGSVAPDTKIDIGTVRTLDPAHGIMICDMPDGQVTYDVTAAQVFDEAGKPLGAASALHPGDKVRVVYIIGNGAKVSEVWVMAP